MRDISKALKVSLSKTGCLNLFKRYANSQTTSCFWTFHAFFPRFRDYKELPPLRTNEALRQAFFVVLFVTIQVVCGWRPVVA
jgi:hypothetical protein